MPNPSNKSLFSKTLSNEPVTTIQPKGSFWEQKSKILTEKSVRASLICNNYAIIHIFIPVLSKKAYSYAKILSH